MLACLFWRQASREEKNMYKEISFNDFCDGFPDSYQNNFSYEGKKALFDYLEEYEDGTGEKIDFDPIALCCEYSEYKDLKELQGNYNVESMEDLENHTVFIKIDDNSFIIQNF